MREATREALALHRGHRCPTIAFRPALDRLLDDDHASYILKLLEKYGGEWESRPALPALAPDIPDVPGLYMFVWRPSAQMRQAAGGTFRLDWVLYVGQAGANHGKGTLRSRYKTEYSKYVAGDAAALWDSEEPPGREAKLRRYLTLEPLEYWWLEFSDPRYLARCEQLLIELLGPPLNKVGKLVVTQTVDAWG